MRDFYIEPNEPKISLLDELVNRKPIDSNLALLLKSQDKLRLNKQQWIEFSKPILFHLGLPIVFPKTINVIQGKKGQHKSRLAEYFCAALLIQSVNEKVLIGLEKNTEHNYTVVYVDTERNLDEQFPYALQQIQLKAGYRIEEHPINFEYCSLLEIERGKRYQTLNLYIENLRKRYSNHLFIVLDVLTDCVENFNDPRSSLELIDLINVTINQHNVTFLCVIHENPGTEKARGHLGTEIINKASLVLSVGFLKDKSNRETDLLKVSYLHSRNTKRYEPFYLEYSDIEHGLVIKPANEVQEEQHLANQKAPIEDVIEFLANTLVEPQSKSDLIEKLIEYFDCSQKTLEGRLSEILESKFEIVIGARRFYLSKRKKSKLTEYYLTEIENSEITDTS